MAAAADEVFPGLTHLSFLFNRIGIGGEAKNMRKSFRQRWICMPLLLGVFSAEAIPPPPPAPRQLREARMTVTVRFIETDDGHVSKLTTLCTVSGKIPVYADDGNATRANGREIPGCKMPWKGRNLDVSVRGALAVSRGPLTFAVASVAVTPPDAKPACPGLCGPQALADSRGEITVAGTPRALKFNLSPNPVSIMNARPSVWLEADVKVAD